MKIDKLRICTRPDASHAGLSKCPACYNAAAALYIHATCQSTYTDHLFDDLVPSPRIPSRLTFHSGFSTGASSCAAAAFTSKMPQACTHNASAASTAKPDIALWLCIHPFKPVAACFASSGALTLDLVSPGGCCCCARCFSAFSSTTPGAELPARVNSFG